MAINNVCIKCSGHDKFSQNEGTNPGSLVHTFGGVARNVAECMTRLGSPPFFVSAVGNDQNGKLVTRYLEESGMVREL